MKKKLRSTLKKHKRSRIQKNKLCIFFLFLRYTKMKHLFFFLLLITGLANAQTKSVVYFDSNKSELKTDALKTLDSIAAVLKTANTYSIIINGHCDNTGDDASNQNLSEKRANAVAKYFENKNVSGQNIAVKGFGETNPLASNDDENGKAKNRRAEIQITISASTIVTPVQPIAPSAPSVPDKTTFNDKSTLIDLEVGKTLVLKNLNFEGGTAVLLPEAKPTLEMLLKTMQENPTLEIEIGGHVCCKDDMPLSILRAQSVYKYLVRNGIYKERITYKGHSRNEPIFEDDRDETRARANRRVEITVIKK